DLVAERKWQSAVFGDVEAPVAAKGKIAVLEVQVRVTHPTTGDAHQNFAAARYRAFCRGFPQRLAVGNKRLAVKHAHAVLSPAEPRMAIGTRRPRSSPTILASNTKWSTEISSARAVGSSPAASISFGVSVPSERKLWRSILRRWPNAACVTASSVARSHGNGVARGTNRTKDDFTLGGGTKAEALTSKAMRASHRHCASTDNRPSLLDPRCATIRSAPSRW